MTSMITGRSDNLDAIKSTGVVASAQRSGSSKGCTLVAGTYYFPIGSSDARTSAETPLVSAHLQWSAAVAATITIETSNFPANEGGIGGQISDVTDYSSTVGEWVSENPSTAIVATVGSGNSALAAVVTAGGSAAGACMIHLGNLGSRRARVKIVLTVGGLVRCGVNGKGCA